ncbi:MAG: hypothetical protein MJK14_04220 [Rivularia sp. ALOHA_DT_140]|nr:hypothetical protein [Rivularia sp. ALOHA_DT_140]
MSYKFYSPQTNQLNSNLSLTNYLIHLQQHMIDSRFKQELNYQSQAQLELLASRQKF